MKNRLFAVLAALAAAASLNATTIRIPADQPTIQAGIDAASSDDTVLVSDGTYLENIDFTGKAISLIAEYGVSVTTLQPADADITTITINSGEGAGTSFQGFTVTGGGNAHTFLVDNSSPTISDNVFADNIPVGGNNIEVISCSNSSALITRNLFYDNGGIACVGLRDGAAGVQIINNTFDGNARGFFSIAFGGIALNNIVTNSLQYGIGAPSADHFTLLDYNNIWNNNPDYQYPGIGGVNDISSNPLYVNPADSDYRLQAISPCINAGDPDPQYNDPDGTRNDMGAYAATWQVPIAVGITFTPANGNVVTDPAPEISWTYYDTAATSQDQYEIEAGSDSNWTVAELWATGPVVSGETSALYSGAPLADHAVYFLRMRVHNGTQWGDWVPAVFITHFDQLILVPDDQPTIQAGINAALSGDTVRVADGLYTGDGNRDLEFLGKSIVLQSENGPGSTSIDCEGSEINPHRAVYIHSREDTTATIEGFIITGAYWENRGAITISDASLKIRDCVIDQNLGYGVWSDYKSNLSVSGCTITRNGSAGAYLEANGTITNSEISYNEDDGVYLLAPDSVELSNLLIWRNGGDGIEVETGSPGALTISNNTVVQNHRGLYYYYWPPTAKAALASETTISQNIFALNTDVGMKADGLGLYGYPSCNNSFGNPGGDWVGVYWDTLGNFSADPLFCDTASGDFAIAWESPCAPPNNSCNALIGALDIGCSCCVGITGNVDGDEGELVDVGDLTAMIAYLYIPPYPEPGCMQEGNIDGDTGGLVDIGDLTALIAYLYIPPNPEPAPCQ